MRVLMLFIILVSSQLIFGQGKLPTYSTIVESFFKEYNVPEDNYIDITFAKRPSGWFVTTLKWNDVYYAPVKSELFWDIKTSSYQAVDFEPSTQTNQERKRQSLSKSDVWVFDVSPYYGYDGWEIDVIDTFGSNKSSLTDSTLYALGRAYSSYASKLLGNQYGHSESIRKFNLKRDDKLNTEQLLTYRQYQHQAIEAYQLIDDRNPEFETIVGSIGVKMANEHVTAYFNLMLYSTEEEALKELKDDIYENFYIVLAKNYLNSCAPNAILFTEGDTDTYPIWYVQAKYGFRKDVSVMVLTFLNDNRGVDLVTNGSSTLPPITLSIDATKYDSDGPNAYLPVTDQIEAAISGQRFLDLIQQENESLRYPFGDSYYNFVPTSKLLVSSSEFHKNSTLPASLSANAANPNLLLEINSRGLEMKDLLLLDLIVSNNWKRPIYLNSTSLIGFNFDLNAHLVTEGLCKQLIPINQEAAVDQQRMYRNIMQNFDWNLLLRKEHSSTTKQKFILNYRASFNVLISSLLDENADDKAKEVLKANFKWMPQKQFPWDYFSAAQIGFLLELGESKRAKSMAEAIFKQATSALDLLLEEDTSSEDFEVYLYLQMLQTISQIYSDKEIKNLATKYQSAYNKYDALF